MIPFIVCAAVAPFMLGAVFIRMKKEKGTEALAEGYLLGLLFLFLLAEAVSCIVIKTEDSFGRWCMLLAGTVGAGIVLSLLLGGRRLWKIGREFLQGISASVAEKKEKQSCMAGSKERLYLRWQTQRTALLVLVLLSFAGIFLYVPDTGSDTMVETVSVTAATDTVFAYNPVTGQLLRYGMYPLYKLASLPLLYSGLYRISGMPLQDMMYYAVPIWLLLAAVLILGLWGKLLFGEQKEKKRLFWIFATLLLMMGDGEKDTFAYALLHEGSRGTTAAALIFLFGAYMLCRIAVYREWLYGGLGVLLCLNGILFTRPLFMPKILFWNAQGTGKQWGMLLLAVLALYLARERTKKKWKRREAVLLAAGLLTGLVSCNGLVTVCIAYAGTCLWGIGEEWKRGNTVLAGFIVLICMAGTVFPLQGDCEKRWHVPQAEQEIQDKITALADTYEGESMLLAPEQVMERARLENENIILPYGKNLWREDCNREIADVYTEEELLLFQQMKTDYLQPDTLAAMAAEAGCRILVLRETMSSEAQIQYGWQETESSPGYAVYCK